MNILNNAIKKCTDCIYYRWSIFGRDYATCIAIKITNKVDGKEEILSDYCWIMRSIYGECEPEARLYKEKE